MVDLAASFAEQVTDTAPKRNVELRLGRVNNVNADGTLDVYFLQEYRSPVLGVRCKDGVQAVVDDVVWVLNVSGVYTVIGSANVGGGRNWAGQRNLLGNGAFLISQRGTSGAGSTNATTGRSGPDMWMVYRDGYVAGATWSIQTADPPPGFKNYLRVQRDSGNTSTAQINLAQSLETVDSIQCRNKPFVLSFWARIGSTPSSEGLLLAYVKAGSGTDETYASGFTSVYTLASSDWLLTTTWQKYVVSLSSLMDPTDSQLAVVFEYLLGGTAGVGDYFEITGVQLETDGLTPYEQRTIGDELTRCERYYQACEPVAAGANGAIAMGMCTSTTAAAILVPFRTPMRAQPIIAPAVTAADFAVLGSAGTRVAATALTLLNTSTPTTVGRLEATVAAGLVAGNATALWFSATSASTDRLGFSAEL